MINYDLHIHTEYCGHAEGMAVRDILTTADRIGIKTIGIADHVFSQRDLPTIEKIRSEAAQVNTRCKVIIGAEIDVDGTQTDGRLVTNDLNNIDYIIAGFHYIPGLDKYPRTTADCPLEPDEFIARWQKSLLGIVGNKKVKILAHPARLVSTAINPLEHHEKLMSIFEQAAKISAKNNILWEVNELDGEKIPDDYKPKVAEIFAAAVKNGVKLVFGSDCHSLDNMGSCAFAESVLAKLPEVTLENPYSLGLVK